MKYTRDNNYFEYIIITISPFSHRAQDSTSLDDHTLLKLTSRVLLEETRLDIVDMTINIKLSLDN